MQLIEIFDRGADRNPDKACFVLPDGSRSWSYREVQDLSHRFAAALLRDGYGPGVKVGVLSPNDPIAFAAGILGTLRINGIWVALNAKNTAQGNAQLLADSDAEIVVFHPKMARDMEEVGAVPTLTKTIALDDLDAFLEPEGARVDRPADDPDAAALMVGTGGTTGKPKIVLVTHRMLQQMSIAFAAAFPEDDPVQLLAAPMSHAAGAMTFPVFAEGGTHIVHDGVVPAELLASIERHKVTRLFLPPTAIYALLAHPDVRSFDYSSLKHFLYAAAPMSVAKLREAIDVFGPVMCQSFGQSEAPMICTVFTPREHAEALASPQTERRLASCGRSSLVATVAIMDDDGNLVAQGERGEIVVRGGLVMSAYYKDEEKTAETKRPGGWHGTGDVGQIDEDGFVYIVDRKRDLIISGGFNVFPSEVEQVIWGHPAVADCAVIGLPDEKWGERVTAVVELKEGQEVDGAELVALCREALGPVKTPKEIVFRTLPRSPVGKVLKRALRDEYWTAETRAV